MSCRAAAGSNVHHFGDTCHVLIKITVHNYACLEVDKEWDDESSCLARPSRSTSQDLATL